MFFQPVIFCIYCSENVETICYCQRIFEILAYCNKIWYYYFRQKFVFIFIAMKFFETIYYCNIFSCMNKLLN